MTEINKSIIKKLLTDAGDKLKGDWVLLGGALLPLLHPKYRATHDIDLAGYGTSEQGQLLDLIQIAESLGLPIDSINQAATYYLHKIPNWQAQLIQIHKGKRATIHRPTATLYLLLKINRLSESDAQDCELMLKISKELKEQINKPLIVKAIKGRLTTDNQDLKQRLLDLESKIDRLP